MSTKTALAPASGTLHNGAHVPTIDRRPHRFVALLPSSRVALAPGLATAQSQVAARAARRRTIRRSVSACRRSRSRRRRSRRTSRRFRSASRPCRKTPSTSAGIHIVSEAAIFAPNTFFTEWSAQKAEQRPLPRHQLEPEQPGHHHLHRRRAAAERQLVEHRAARRRSDRVRARSAERALRPQHARRPGEHHERAAVAVELDRRALRAVRQPRLVGGPRRRLGSGRRGQAQPRRVVRAGGPRRVHGQRRHRQRHRLPLGVLGQGAAAVDAEQRLGRRASSSPASGRATATTRSTTSAALRSQSVPRRARLRGSRRSRRRRHDDPGAARRAARWCSRARRAS